MIDLTEGVLERNLEYAKTINDTTLQDCLDRLKKADEYHQSETKVFKDWAARSFEFARLKENKCILNGGIIFHGPHDNGGDGSSSTFSVTMDNNLKPHWQIHT